MTTAVTWALAVILLLAIVYVAWLVWRRLQGPAVKRGKGKRIGVVEAHNIGKERQLLLVRRDDVEHLVLIGGENDLVIETGIEMEEEAAPVVHAAPPMAPRRPQAPPAPPPAPEEEPYEEEAFDEPSPFVPGPAPDQRIPPLPPRRPAEGEY